jgi:hypothetical protein
MNSRPILPAENKDITSRVIRGYVIRFAAAAVWCAFVFIGFTTYDGGSRFDEMSPVVINLFALVIGLIIPAYILRLHKPIFDRSWSGLVKSVGIGDEIAAGGDMVGMRGISQSIGQENINPVFHLNVELAGGEYITMKYKPNAQSGEHLAYYYNAGDTVYYFKGTKYPKKATNIANINGRGYRLCIVCGRLNEPEQSKCGRCNSTIVE